MVSAPTGGGGLTKVRQGNNPPYPPRDELGDTRDAAKLRLHLLGLWDPTVRARILRSLNRHAVGPSARQISQSAPWASPTLPVTQKPPHRPQPHNSTPCKSRPSKRERGGGTALSLLEVLRPEGRRRAGKGTKGLAGSGLLGKLAGRLAALANDLDDTGFHGHWVGAAKGS